MPTLDEQLEKIWKQTFEYNIIPPPHSVSEKNIRLLLAKLRQMKEALEDTNTIVCAYTCTRKIHTDVCSSGTEALKPMQEPR